MTGADQAGSTGLKFVQALARKDYRRVRDLLRPDIDFRGMTPRRYWEASDPDSVVEDVLPHWFDESDHVEEVVAVETDSIGDRFRIGYRLRVRNSDGLFIGEQQAYYLERDNQIAWMRIMCSGFQPIAD